MSASQFTLRRRMAYEQMSSVSLFVFLVISRGHARVVKSVTECRIIGIHFIVVPPKPGRGHLNLPFGIKFKVKCLPSFFYWYMGILRPVAYL